MDTLTVLLVLVPLLVSVERSECVRCFAHFNTASGECDAEIGEVPEEDCCQNPHYGYLATDGECRSCGPPVWSPWSSWSLCNTLCGDGVRQKTRTCFGTGQPTCHEPGDKLRMEPCVGTCCEVVKIHLCVCVCVDKEWYAWLPWSPCSVTCGGVGVRNRKRVCSGPPECRLACSAPSEETEKCDSKNQCPGKPAFTGVDDGRRSMLSWLIKVVLRILLFFMFKQKTETFQLLKQLFSTRLSPPVCLHPSVSTRLSPPVCLHPSVSTRLSPSVCLHPSVSTRLSPPIRLHPSVSTVHGTWSSWLGWSRCSGECIDDQRGDAIMPSRTRQRTCSNPAPSTDTTPHGNSCPGDSSQRQDCSELPNCPVDGQWGAWSPHELCSVSCGEGLQLSNRKCNNPEPKYGGKICEGPSTQSRVCRSPCPGKKTHSKTHKHKNTNTNTKTHKHKHKHKDTQRHIRHINTNTKAKAKTQRLKDSKTQRHTDADSDGNLSWSLPVHGFWSGWSNWGDCSASCISEGQKLPTRTRHRSCSNPAPSSSPPGQACPGQANDVGNCEFLPYCQVNGVWGVWSPYSSCPVTCGVGLQTSSRKCDSPAPKHGGTPCPGNGDQTKICSTKVHCPGKQGFRVSESLCDFCVFAVNGVWSEWTKWTVCAYPFRPTNIKCKQIGGSQTRERTCLYQDHGGSICSGDELLQSQVCYYVEGCYSGYP
ncbi:properdin-like [Odontesthes bonariensis]